MIPSNGNKRRMDDHGDKKIEGSSSSSSDGMNDNDDDDDNSSVMMSCYNYCFKGCLKSGSSLKTKAKSRRRRRNRAKPLIEKKCQDLSHADASMRQDPADETEMSSMIARSSSQRQFFDNDDGSSASSRSASLNTYETSLAGDSSTNGSSTEVVSLLRRRSKDSASLNTSSTKSTFSPLEFVDRQQTLSTVCSISFTEEDHEHDVEQQLEGVDLSLNHQLNSFLGRGNNSTNENHSISSSNLLDDFMGGGSNDSSMNNAYSDDDDVNSDEPPRNNDNGGGAIISGGLNMLERHLIANQHSRDGMIELERKKKLHQLHCSSIREDYSSSEDDGAMKEFEIDEDEGTIHNDDGSPITHRLEDVIQLLISEDPNWMGQSFDDGDDSSSSDDDSLSRPNQHCGVKKELESPSLMHFLTKEDQQQKEEPVSESKNLPLHTKSGSTNIKQSSTIVQEARDSLDKMLDEQHRIREELLNSSSPQG